MKCPMFTIASCIAHTGKEIMWTDCRKEECAWWDDKFQQCVAITIAEQLMRQADKSVRHTLQEGG